MYLFFIQLSLAEYTPTEIWHQTWGPFADGRTLASRLSWVNKNEQFHVFFWLLQTQKDRTGVIELSIFEGIKQ